MSNKFMDAVKERRTYYGLTKEVDLTEDKIKELVYEAVKYTPSAFNSQSARVVLLLEGEHDKLWDITKEALRKIVPADSFASTEEKMNAFKSAYGTVLFFEDQDVITGLQENFALYKDNFPVWSEQSTGMLQFVVWTSLREEGLGASLQHYNEVIVDDVKKEWNLPKNWKLTAQMPFGKPSFTPDAKQFNLKDEHIRFYK